MSTLKRIKRLFLENRFYDYNEYRLKRFVKRAASLVDAGKSLLDVGAGQLQYKEYFLNVAYKSQDSCVGDEGWDYSRVDIVSEIYDMPVADESFDYVLCTQVLEHLKYPHQAFAEMSRVIRPGGLLFVTCPLAWKEHQKPHDFFRYTRYALAMMAEENGFRVKEINKVGGKFITLSRLWIDLNLVFRIKNRWLRRLAVVISYPFDFLVGLLGYCLDVLDKEKDLTLQHECIFEKK
jgi:SAM-dependent methyltransferase